MEVGPLREEGRASEPEERRRESEQWRAREVDGPTEIVRAIEGREGRATEGGVEGSTEIGRATEEGMECHR